MSGGSRSQAYAEPPPGPLSKVPPPGVAQEPGWPVCVCASALGRGTALAPPSSRYIAWPSPTAPALVANPAGRISTAEYCYEHIRATLCGPSWQPGRSAAISKFVTFYATNHEVDSQTRHVNRSELSQCPRLMSSYSYFAFEKDVVLQRRFDCSCHACLRATRPEERVDPMIDRDGTYAFYRDTQLSM